jgi:hypothetical protein
MNLIERRVKDLAHPERRCTPDYRGQKGLLSMPDPDREFAHADSFQCVVGGAKRILNEILDGRQHPRNHVGIPDRNGIGDYVLQEQAGLVLNEKDLLDPIEKTPEKCDFSIRFPGSGRLDTPSDTPEGDAGFDDLIEGLDQALQRGCDRAPDRASDYREQCFSEDTRVFANRIRERLLEEWLQGLHQTRVAAGTQQNGVGQYLAQVDGSLRTTSNALAKFIQLSAFWSEQKVAEFIKVAILCRL